MLGEQGEGEDGSGSYLTFYSHDFYAAIMEEDVERLEDVSKKRGSSFLNEVQEAAPGKVFWKGLAPLHLAASYRRVKSMRSLLSAGADPEMRDQLGRTALHLVITGWPSILSARLMPESKFQSAVISGHKKAEACLQLLCEHGVNVNAKVEGECEQTALHLSVRYAALPAVRILVRHGADVNAVDGCGMAPLHMAAGMLHKEIIADLIRQGAEVNMGMKHTGNTPLHLAAAALAMKAAKTPESDIGCVSELLEHGAEADAENKAGITPLQEACGMGHGELAELLLGYGADVNKLSRAGENCLFLFLNQRPNARSGSLLVKLLSLTSPLTVYDRRGRLPAALTLPRFFEQRDQILRLVKQPRTLQDICKSNIYLKHVRGKKEELKKILPERLYDFVFNYWANAHNISFVTDDEQNSFNDIFDITSS